VKPSDRLTFALLRAEPLREHWFDDGDGEFLLDGIMREGLGPALYLHSRESRFLPDSIKTRCSKACEDALLFKDYSVCCLEDLQPALSGTGRVVIIKGLALCESIYREPLARPMGDVDLYFPDGSIDRARDVFVKNGYTYLDSSRTVVCKGDLHVDLHDDLWNARRIQRRTRCVPEKIEAFEPSHLVPGFYVPTPSLLAIHSSYHAIKHCFSRMLWYLDIILMHKAGYFEESAARDNRMALIVLDRCNRIGLIREKSSVHSVPNYKRSLLHTVLSMNLSPGAGECALALSMPSLRGTFSYITESLVPRKEILSEMYGNYPYIFLVIRRIFVILSYGLGMLIWKKTR
jgi:Uncharacterised nucleotidyltransferase